VLKDLSHHPAFRTAALLFSVAVVGTLIGVAWEDVTYGKAESSLEQMEARAAALEAKQESKEDAFRRSKREEAILARSLTYFPPYPNAGRPEALAADYLGPDVPIAVAFFTTKDSSDQVIQHYRKVILDQGLPVIGARFSENSGYVGYWEPETEEVRLVSTLHQGGETMAFVSAGRMGNLLQRRSIQIPEWAPVPPDLREAATLTLNMEGLQNTTVTGRMAAQSVEQAEQAYRSTLRLQGWTAEAGSSSGFQQREFVVSNTGMRGQVILKQATGSAEVEFHLSLMQKPEVLP
jgi:hypothetical protein